MLSSYFLHITQYLMLSAIIPTPFFYVILWIISSLDISVVICAFFFDFSIFFFCAFAARLQRVFRYCHYYNKYAY
jgi:hypothetical protein